ncbi:MAG: crossover junction endodeoxyribonuclease RuvC [Dissulfurispiraceae bacterium]|jgi:crossover junction endodeoxyribonuclease RuvC|nr:crossover junction endodeoxyribonuclease RuvC [Dissulfurispiraceae bacterium]
MKILGIDPGSVKCGYGIISMPDRKAGLSNTSISGRHYQYVSSGIITMHPTKLLHVRLKELYESLSELIAEYQPDEIAVEKMFFAKGIKAALSLGHTRGVVLAAAASTGLHIHEYSPLEVKKAVVGYGKAEKSQVQIMVRQLLGINKQLTPDSADALAIAICHVHMKAGAAY